MKFKEWVKNILHVQPVINEFFYDKEESTNGVEYYGMFFRNLNDLTTYKKHLISLGRCPLCNDFLFISIKDYNVINGYNSIIECVNHNCQYNKDNSGEFNKSCGINKDNNDTIGKKSTPLPPLSHIYYNTFVEDGTGLRVNRTSPLIDEDFFIRKSFENKVRRNIHGVKDTPTQSMDMFVEVVKDLPVNPKKDRCYIWNNGNGYNLYTYTNNQWLIMKEGLDLSLNEGLDLSSYEFKL